MDNKDTVKAILNRWPSLHAIAADVGVKPIAVKRWKQRSNIPARHDMALIASARKRGIRLKAGELMASRAVTQDGHAMTFKVKPLDWKNGQYSSLRRDIARSVFGLYVAGQWADGSFGGSIPASDPKGIAVEITGYTSLEEAKAFCAENYETRVRALISIEEATQ